MRPFPWASSAMLNSSLTPASVCPHEASSSLSPSHGVTVCSCSYGSCRLCCLGSHCPTCFWELSWMPTSTALLLLKVPGPRVWGIVHFPQRSSQKLLYAEAHC